MLRVIVHEGWREMLEALLRSHRARLAASSMQGQVAGDRAAPADEAGRIGRAVTVCEDDDGGVLDDVVGVVDGGHESTRSPADRSLVRGEQGASIRSVHHRLLY